jgi:hypothetical protein
MATALAVIIPRFVFILLIKLKQPQTFIFLKSLPTAQSSGLIIHRFYFQASSNATTPYPAA